MIEISRMRRQAEKVAGPWAGHGAMCWLLAPRLALVVTTPAAKAQSTPATGPLWDGPALLFGAIWVSPTTSPSGASLLPAVASPGSSGTRVTVWSGCDQPQATACDGAVLPPYRKAGGKLTQMMPQILPQILWGCCERPAARHRAKGRENQSSSQHGLKIASFVVSKPPSPLGLLFQEY